MLKHECSGAANAGGECGRATNAGGESESRGVDQTVRLLTNKL